MKAALVLALVCASFVVSGVGRPPSNAAACSLAPLELRYLPNLVERTPIIAIGTWAEAGEYEATLVVDESLKGTEAGARHVFDNRATYTMVACSPYDEDFHSGFRFKDGQRSVVFMDKQVDGLWQIAWSSFAAFDVPVDDLAPMSIWQVETPPTLLADVRAAVAAAPALEPDQQKSLETRLGCNPPYLFDAQKVAEYTGLATSGVALVTVTESPPLQSGTSDDRVVARIDEILAGGLAPNTSITLNDRWISDDATGDCTPALESGRRGLAEGSQYLVFLRQDEFGIADYRPVAWGGAVVGVNEKFLTGGQITLADIRELTGTVRTEPASSGVTPAGDPTSDTNTAAALTRSDSDGNGPLMNVLIVVAVAGTLGAGWFVIRARRGARG